MIAISKKYYTRNTLHFTLVHLPLLTTAIDISQLCYHLIYFKSKCKCNYSKYILVQRTCKLLHTYQLLDKCNNITIK